MGLKKIPTRTDDSLGRPKSDGKPPEDLETELTAAEHNELAEVVIDLATTIGLDDGSMLGSIEARLLEVEECCKASIPWSRVSERPSSLEGYGINDAYSQASGIALDARVSALEGSAGPWPYFPPLFRYQFLEGPGIPWAVDTARSPYWPGITLVPDGEPERIPGGGIRFPGTNDSLGPINGLPGSFEAPLRGPLTLTVRVDLGVSDPMLSTGVDLCRISNYDQGTETLLLAMRSGGGSLELDLGFSHAGSYVVRSVDLSPYVGNQLELRFVKSAQGPGVVDLHLFIDSGGGPVAALFEGSVSDIDEPTGSLMSLRIGNDGSGGGSTCDLLEVSLVQGAVAL